MNYIEAINRAVCSYGVSWSSCPASFWGTAFTPDRLWSLATILSGAFITYIVQYSLKWQDRRSALKERLLGCVMVVSAIKSDMDSLQNSIAIAKADGDVTMPTWRKIKTLHHSTTVDANISQALPLTSLRSRDLIEKAMYLINEHARMRSMVDGFNEHQAEYFDNHEAWRHTLQVHRLHTFEAHISMYLSYIDETTRAVSSECDVVHQMIGAFSQKRLGTKSFLRME